MSLKLYHLQKNPSPLDSNSNQPNHFLLQEDMTLYNNFILIRFSNFIILSNLIHHQSHSFSLVLKLDNKLQL